jgi:hypothetical protein
MTPVSLGVQIFGFLLSLTFCAVALYIWRELRRAVREGYANRSPIKDGVMRLTLWFWPVMAAVSAIGAVSRVVVILAVLTE